MYKTVKYILNKYKNIDINQKYEDGILINYYINNTLLHAATSNGKFTIVEYFLKTYEKLNINQLNDDIYIYIIFMAFFKLITFL